MKKFTKPFLFALLTVVINLANAAISVNPTVTNVRCEKGADGTINLNPAGGTSPYSYWWSGGATSQTRIGLVAATYYVTVTDALGFTGTAAIVVNEPPAVIISKNITHVTCGGGANGAVDLTVSGGVPGYTYLWADGATTQDRTNITAANYYFTVTDANGCVKPDSANVTQPAGLVLSKTTTNVTCGSGANGAINLTVQFGNGAYTYLWNDGATTEDRSGIAAGTYSITVTDAIGCSASTTVTVAQSGAGMAVNTTHLQPSCNGGSNGTITVTSVIGSVGPYTFLWSDGAATQNRTGIASGTYVVTATSSTGCTASATVNVGQPTKLMVTLTPFALTCFGSNNGAINTSPTGGTSPYTYNWGGGIFTQNRTGLPTGNYTVTVTDNKGCTATATTFVAEPLALVASPVPSPLACVGGPTGSVTTSVNGGTGPYSYWWGGGVTTQNLVNVNSGTYSVTVTDANGCTATASSTIAAYVPVSLSSAQVNVTCLGGNNGSVDLTPGNGWVPYSYMWSNSATTQDISGLTAGNYTVTVIDGHACTTTRTVSVTQPGFGINVNSTVVDPWCNGSSNGSITLTVSNGNAPYTYNWGGGVMTQNRSGLSAGTYVVTVTDNSGCSVSSTNTLNQPTAITVTTTPTNALCFGSSTGSISTTVSGGQAPYTYNWGGGVTTQNRSSIPAGSYSVTVTDTRSCTALSSVVVGQAAQLSVTANTVNVSCNGSNDGSISLAITGGNSPYAFNWGGGVTTQNRTGLVPGNYTVTVTDLASCTSTATATVTQPLAFTVSLSTTNASCFGGTNGTITTTTTGGNAPFTFNWGSGVTTQNRIGLSAGSYTVTTTDNNSCSTSATVNISQATALNISSTVTNVLCNSGNTGTITLTVSGATSPYTFSWAGGITTQNRSGLTSGNYMVTVTDNAGCTASNTTTITQPAALAIASSVTNAVCNGSTTGGITLNITGGTSPYNFIWSDGVFSQNRTNVLAGNYSVTVTDNASCSSSVSAIVGQNAAINITPTVVNVACNGASTGGVNISISGGATPYTFNWGGGITTQNRAGLSVGTYTVTVTDNALCSASGSAIVGQNNAITVSSTTTNVACNGGNNGTVNLTVAGGTSPYSFSWAGGITTQNRTGLTAGSYTVTVTDNLLCTTTHTATVSQSTSLSVSAAVTHVTCNAGNNGSINLSVSGGTSPYSYNWGGGITTQNRTSLAAGSYTVTVSDNAGCSISNTTIITEPTAIVISANITHVTCAGGSTGAIDISITGGTPGYTFAWGDGPITEDRANVTAGTYMLTVTDASLCVVSNSMIVVNQNPTLTITPIVSDALCFGNNNGSIDAVPTGGNLPYTFVWNNGATTQQRTSLVAGSYQVTVTDNAGCSGSANISVSQPVALQAVGVVTNVSCFGGNNGIVNVNATGGTTPFTYAWAGGATTQSRTGLVFGLYSVTVSDSHGCTFATNSTVNQPSAITISSTPTNISCYGGSNGSITLNVTGGAGAYTYNWGGGVNTQNRSNLPTGSYTVTVTDLANCTNSNTTTLIEGSQITTSSTIINATCYGSSTGSIDLSVTGGASTYSYLWSNGATTQDVSTLQANNYSVTITDANTCTSVVSISIAQPGQIVLSTTSTAVGCNGNSNASIDLTVSGGFAPYFYNWSNGSTLEDVSNASAGNYSVVVTDNSSCSVSAAVAITQPAALSATANITQVSCYGSSNGAVTLTVTGGSSPYSYIWSNGSANSSLSNLSAGNVDVTITDNNGCTTTAFAAIVEPTLISLSTTKTDVICNGASSGSIDLSVTGGSGSYSYDWNNGFSTEDLASVNAGSYSVTVLDGNNCSAVTTTVIAQPSPMSVAINLQNVKCFGGNNGAISTTASGGNGGYVYNWSNGGTTSAISGLTAGSYTLWLNDAMACATTLTLNVMQPTQLLLSETHVNVSCAGGNNGSVDLTVSGGSPAYTYLWNNAGSTQDMSGALANQYTVVVTDANLCTSSLNVNITEPSPVVLSTTITDVLCNGASTGSVSLGVAGGAPPYSYSWTGGIQSQNLSNVSAGPYYVTVTDANNCTAGTSATINQNTAIQISFVKTDASCFGAADGSINTATTGGNNSTYSYLWSNTNTGANVNSLVANTYAVTVTDASGCSTSASEVISEPSQISLGEQHSNVLCNGGSTGSIQITPSGGTGSISLVWNTGSTSATLSNLTANTYTVSATDANGCSTTGNVTVSEPLALTLNETHTDFACASTQGSIDVTVSGGTMPYNFVWNNAETSEDLTNLPSGSYSVVVTDNNLCSANIGAVITAITPLTSSIIKSDLTCHANFSGSVDLIVSGGSLPYSYLWSSGAQTEDLNGVIAGSYSVIVRDANNCSLMNSTTVAEPTEIAIIKNVTDISCNGNTNGAIDLYTTGGVAPYSFTWSNTATTEDISSLANGFYSVTITDANNCTMSEAAITITEPAAISILSTVTDVACAGHADGSISLNVNGGTPPYNYVWSTHTSNSSTLPNINSGNYSATVVDSKGCQSIKNEVVGMTLPLEVTPQLKNTSCPQVENGWIDLVVEGGTPSYSFYWSNGENSEDVTSLALGSYSVTITDSRNCTLIKNYSVGYDYNLTLDASPSVEINLGESTTLSATPSAEHNNVYSWTPAARATCATCQNTEVGPVNNTQFTVNVVDENGCSATDTVTVRVNSITDIFIPNAFSPNGDGNNDAFQIFGDLNALSYLDIKVFNRWGEKVFESNDHNFMWDGTYKGEVVPQGSYVYVMKAVFVNGYSRNDFKGSLAIIR